MSIIERLQAVLSVVTAPKSEKGAAMVEYAILVAFIAIIVLVAVTALGQEISSLFGGINL